MLNWVWHADCEWRMWPMPHRVDSGEHRDVRCYLIPLNISNNCPWPGRDLRAIESLATVWDYYRDICDARNSVRFRSLRQWHENRIDDHRSRYCTTRDHVPEWRRNNDGKFSMHHWNIWCHDRTRCSSDFPCQLLKRTDPLGCPRLRTQKEPWATYCSRSPIYWLNMKWMNMNVSMNHGGKKNPKPNNPIETAATKMDRRAPSIGKHSASSECVSLDFVNMFDRSHDFSNGCIHCSTTRVSPPWRISRQVLKAHFFIFSIVQ